MAWRQTLFSPMSRAIVALGTVLALTLVMFTARYALESDNANIDFAQRAHIRIAALTGRIGASIDSLRSVSQLFVVSHDDITRDQFHQFTQPYLSDYPYIHSFVFHRLISREERKSYEASIPPFFPNLEITELRNGQLVRASDRDLYLVNEYVEPLAGNEVALGYDLFSDPIQEQTFWRATNTGRPAATPLKNLLGQIKGFTIHMPVYRHGALLMDAAARRAAIVGGTEAVFIAENLVRKILADNSLLDLSGFDINVYAGGGVDENKLAFRHGGRPPVLRKPASSFPAFLFLEDPKVVARNFDLAGQPWHIVVSSLPQPVSVGHFGSLMILLAGSLLSVGVALRIHAAAMQARRVEELVQLRTAELRSTADALELRQRAIEASQNAIVIASANAPDFSVEYVNPAFERSSGYSAQEVIGKPMCTLQAVDQDQEAITGLKAAIHARQEAHMVFQHRRKDGTLYWNDVYIAPVKNERGEVHHYVCMQYDVTETRRYQEELEFRANYDTLTGLANRNLLRDRLMQAMSYASRYQHAAWVAFIDLDRFKFVNDSLGHRAGDELLKTVSGRLQSLLSDVDTAARLGGDEFILVLPGDAERRGTAEMITRLLDEIAKPAVIQGKEFFITASIGIAIYPNDGTDPDALISHADIAMFRAKEMGGNNFKFFETSMNESTLKRLQLEGDLRKALDNGEFELHYQPQADLRTGKMIGAEALIRWQHPHLSSVSPARFIGLAEETGMIVQIGKWALRTACMQNKAWQDAGLAKVRVAVNLSALEFAQPDFVETVTSALAQSQLSPEWLEIEMTESVVMRNVETVIPKLRELKALGIKLSVDDFGTGYSSLAYLTRFPIDGLKIDQAFVRNIPAQPDSATLVASIISIGHNLHLRVIAEGVETPEQLAFLQANDCDEIQGHYYSEPLTAAGLEQWLSEERLIRLVQH